MNNNTEKFSGKADIYAKARPGYAKDAIEYLEEIGINQNTKIADIGSGTGIFSQYLLNLGAEVYGVEPNKDMREKAESNLNKHPKFHSIAANAENTTLENKSIDFITAAQAFHWFDTTLFKKECQRILKTNGKVILLWNNGSSVESGLSKECSELFLKFCPAVKDSRSNNNIIESINCFFENYETLKFENNLIYDKDIFILKTLSSSYSLKPEDKNYDKYIKELEKVFDKYQENGKIISFNETVLYVGKI